MATISCAGDEFEAGPGDGGAGATSTSSTSTTSGEGGGTPGATTTASTVSSGEGGSAVSTGEGGGGGGAGGNEGGGGSGPVGDCDPELSGEVPVPASCGIFVDPNRPEGEVGTGAQDDPFRSINDAVEAVAAQDERRIYVTESVTAEHVVIDVEGLQVFGGLTTQWRHRADGRTQVVQEAGDDEVAAMVVQLAPTDVTIHAFRIEGKSTSAPGESSIALLVDRAHVRLARTEIIAHDGADGLDGVTPDDDIGSGGIYDPDLAGVAGSAPPAGSTQGGAGGTGGVNRRPGCDSQGGRGGNGASSLGIGGDYSAGDGQPGLREGAQTAAGGQGAEVEDGDLTNCTAGDSTGGSRITGADGESATGVGTISPVDGFVHAQATDGERGPPGPAGGGGGGGRRQPDRGYGGGGGGAGGCGGFGGRAGQSGGSSFGIVAIDATIFFDPGVSISVSAGGSGGDGALGQYGAPGGRGAGVPFGSESLSCRGGDGWWGEPGGVGGAGAGGHSMGVAHASSTIVGQATIGISAPGNAGMAASEATGPADSGLAVPIYQF